MVEPRSIAYRTDRWLTDSTEDPSFTLELLLRRHEISPIYRSLTTARGNATHVGTVELIRALSEAVLTLEDDNAMP